MKRMFTAFVASMAAVAALGAQSTQRPQTPQAGQDPAKQPEITLTGCLIQGTGPTVFLLDNAKASTAEPTEKGKTYVLARGAEDLNFQAQLNKEVSVTGAAEAKAAPLPAPGQKVDEKDLPKLNAKSLTMVADRCSAAPR
jgi:hypothetical protein